ncbi:MAG: ferrous iron transport protein A [Lachnospiraceae bacterium]|nr:ferrous iron transport protein A [Lachnospiraceae bacterium]
MDGKQNLCVAAIGGEYEVVGMELPRATQMRLTALGLTQGTHVRVLNNKRSGSVIFHVRGTRLAVGRKIAEHIYIR